MNRLRQGWSLVVLAGGALVLFRAGWLEPLAANRVRIGCRVGFAVCAISLGVLLLPRGRLATIARWAFTGLLFAGLDALFIWAGWFDPRQPPTKLGEFRGLSVVCAGLLFVWAWFTYRRLAPNQETATAVGDGGSEDYVLGFDAKARLEGIAFTLALASLCAWLSVAGQQTAEDVIGLRLCAGFFGAIALLGAYRLLRGPKPMLRAGRRGVWIWIDQKRHFVPWHAVAGFSTAPNPKLEDRPALVVGFRQEATMLPARMGSALWTSAGLLLVTTSVLPGPLERHVAALNAMRARAEPT